MIHAPNRLPSVFFNIRPSDGILSGTAGKFAFENLFMRAHREGNLSSASTTTPKHLSPSVFHTVPTCVNAFSAPSARRTKTGASAAPVIGHPGVWRLIKARNAERRSSSSMISCFGEDASAMLSHLYVMLSRHLNFVLVRIAT